jgi:hypothetical protein
VSRGSFAAPLATFPRVALPAALERLENVYRTFGAEPFTPDELRVESGLKRLKYAGIPQFRHTGRAFRQYGLLDERKLNIGSKFLRLAPRAVVLLDTLSHTKEFRDAALAAAYEPAPFKELFDFFTGPNPGPARVRRHLAASHHLRSDVAAATAEAWLATRRWLVTHGIEP